MTSTSPVTRQDVLRRIKDLKTAIAAEEMQRHDVRQSPEYRAAEADLEANDATLRELAAEGQAIRARMNEMTGAVPNSTFELDEAKRSLIELMQLEGVEGYNEDWITATGRWSEKKSVNGRRLLEALGGDIDEFTKLAKPTQKAVKDLATERPELKKMLLGCIVLDSRDLVDVDIQIPDDTDA